MSEPLLDAADIQGDLLPGFRRQNQLIVGFSGTAPEALRAALAALVPRVTPMATVLGSREDRKLALRAGAAPAGRGDLWLNLALGVRAMRALGATAPERRDLAFAAGMVPSRTGDCSNAQLADGSANRAHPRHWVVGGPQRPVDLLCVFAADADIEAAAADLVEAVEQAGLVQVYAERGALLPGDIEHFGFVDGLSQPGVRGLVEVDGEQRFVTTRYGVPPVDGRDYGKPGQLLADPDQFVFADNDEPELRNGSFLVLRRLTQDVAAFYEDTDRLADTLSGQCGTAVSGADLRARIVGRQTSGQPLMRPAADPARPESALAQNHFQFAQPLPAIVLSTGEHVGASAADPDPIRGLLCPAWSHIRKVNPRDLGTDRGGPDETLGFQMLRRGIPFGPLFLHDRPGAPQNREERGLLFLSFQTSISNQFEILNSGWMNSLDGPAPYGHDLLVGQALADGRHGPKTVDFHHRADAEAERFQALKQWVTPTGGAYLFAPGIAALRALAT